MKEIPLTQGRVALVGDEDYERVSARKWHLYRANKLYARTSLGTGRGVISLHRFLMNAPEGVEVDHENGDGLDCRKQNMRIATDAQNKRNRDKYQTNTSGYKGVRLDASGRWTAQIRIGNGKRLYSCGHVTAEDAAHAYDALATEHHGAFARLNFS